MESLKKADELWLKRDATNGIRLYDRLLGEVETAFGKDSSEAGLVLFRIGFFYAQQGDFEKALPSLERSLKLIEPLPEDDQNLLTKANLCWCLGIGYQTLLRFDPALQAFKRSLALNEKRLGPESPGLTESLKRIAEMYYQLGRPLEAIPLFERALGITEKSSGSESVEVAQMLASIGNTWSHAGEFNRALNCLTRSLAIREMKLEAINPEIGIASFNLGSLYLKLGDSSKAIPLLERSVELLEKNLPATDTPLQSAFQLASALDALGLAETEQGDYEKGLSRLQKSLAVTETNFGGASINLVRTLNNIAVVYRRQGDFEHALPLLERALRIVENAPPHKTEEFVDTLNNLAELCRSMGDESTALRLYNRSMESAERLFGADYISLAYSLNGLALIYAHREENSKAITFFERSLRIMEKNVGQPPTDIAGFLNNYSALLWKTGDKNRALSTLQRALVSDEKFISQKNRATATALNNLALILEDYGEFSEAKELLRRSVAITDDLFGKDNPHSCEALENLAVVEIESGDWSKGLGGFVESTRRWRRHMAAQITVQQALGATRIQEEVQSSRNWIHSLCRIAPTNYLREAAFFGAEQVAFGKAQLEEVESLSSRLAADGRVHVRTLREQAKSIRKKLDAYASHGEQTAWVRERAEWRKSEKDKLEQELKVIETKIAATSELVGLAVKERDLSLTDIARSLPPNAVLVDLAQYCRTDFIGGPKQWREQRYSAHLTFRLPKGSTNIVVERLDLGEAAPINEAVNLIIRRMADGQFRAKDLQAALERISELVYAPLAAHLTNVSHLIVCPDGQLTRLPFEMLPVTSGATNRFLIEEKTVSYVGSGREIFRLASATRGRGNSSALVVGNPDFDLDLTATSAASRKTVTEPNLPSNAFASARTRGLSRSFQRGKFIPLTNTAIEARSVARLLGNNSLLRLGAEAREAEIKSVRSPRVLHLATHGFFMPDQERKQIDPLREGLLSDYEKPTGRLSDWENPLVRCGVALAGANYALQMTNSAEDGLLTGEEAALLNLQGTELVILSACDTGTGEVKIGEGVMSLRRAFRIAGAETVLASHWPVGDKATSQLMTEFMRRWRSGKPRAQAWREAQLSLLHSKEFANPYFWAGFTLTGQWQ